MSPAATSIAPSARAYLVLALILPVFAVAPLFYPGYIQTHSGFVPVWNLADWRAHGPWPWIPHLATRFDPLRSDGLLLYYLAGGLPFEPVVALKVVAGFGLLSGSLGMLVWLKNWLDWPGALVAALVYTYLPYRIATIYVRGAWGEALFWGLLPWAIFLSQRAGEVNNSSSNPLYASRFTLYVLRFTLICFIWLLLGLSQLGLTIWAFGFVLLLLLALQGRHPFWPIAVPFFGIAIAVMILFAAAPGPAWPAMTRFSDHFIYPFQLFSAFWGFGPSRAGWNDGLSLQLGLAAVGLTLLSVTLWQRPGAENLPCSRTDRRLIFFSAAALVCILLQFGLTNFFWQLPLFGSSYTPADTLSYPWQLSGLAGLCLAVLAGCALWLDAQLARLPLFGSIVILVILSSYSYLEPRFVRLDAAFRGCLTSSSTSRCEAGSAEMPPYLFRQFLRAGPEAQWGPAQLALLAHSFSSVTNGNTAGLDSGPARIPVAVHGPLHAGDILQLNVAWQPLQPFVEDWKIFVHLVDSQGNVLAQFDGQPLQGDYPTSDWIPGELIYDFYPLRWPANAPPGPYRVFLGLYNEASGERLPVPGDPEGKVILNVE